MTLTHEHRFSSLDIEGARSRLDYYLTIALISRAVINNQIKNGNIARRKVGNGKRLVNSVGIGNGNRGKPGGRLHPDLHKFPGPPYPGPPPRSGH